MAKLGNTTGTSSPSFQIGLQGPQLKNNSNVLEARNNPDSAFSLVRGATPVGSNDLTTKQYVDTKSGAVPVSAQFDGNNTLPTNSNAAKYYVVTTTGPNASIGQVLYDDGSGSGTVTVFPATYQIISTTQAFTGGTVTFAANALYAWNGTQWAGLANNTTGGMRTVRFAITNAASQSSAIKIPANAYIAKAQLEIGTPFSPGATIAIGRSGSQSLIQATSDNNPQGSAGDIYMVANDTSWGGTEAVVLVTIAGSPSSGAGVIAVEYSVPDA